MVLWQLRILNQTVFETHESLGYQARLNRHLKDNRVVDPSLCEEHVQLSGHAARHRMDAKPGTHHNVT